MTGILLGQPGPIQQSRQAFYYERYEQSAKLASKATEAHPNDPYVYFLKGISALQLNYWKDAESAFDQGLSFKKRSAHNLAGKGWLRIKQGNIEAGNRLLEEALYRDKGRDPEVALVVVWAYLDAGQRKDAEVLLQKAYALQGEADSLERLQVYFSLGKYYASRGIYEFSNENFEQLIQEFPDFTPAYVWYAETLIQQGLAEENLPVAEKLTYLRKGQQYLTQALTENPNNPRALRARAQLLVRAQDPNSIAQAVRDMENYLRLTEGGKNAQLEYGAFLFLAQQYEACLNQLQRIDTVTAVKLRLMGMSAEKLEKWEEAQRYMDRYFSMKEELYRIAEDYETYGNILVNQQKDAASIPYFEKMIELDPGKNEIWKQWADELQQLAKENAQSLDGETLAQATYQREAFFREIALRKLPANDRKLLSYRFKYSIALYKAANDMESLQRADQAFVACMELKKDLTQPHNYRVLIAGKLMSIDSLTNHYLEPAEDIYEVFSPQPIAEMEDKTQELLYFASYVLADFHLQQQTNPNCSAAAPYIQKALAIRPKAEEIEKLWAYYCP